MMKPDNMSGIGVTGADNPEELSLRAFHILMPAVVFIAVLLVVGLVGNISAFYYYGFKVKARPAQCFIFSLTIFDLMICCISMPMEIIDIRYYHSFPSEIICKTLRFVNYFASIASGCTLIAIAVDRYRKICKPFNKQLTITHARVCVCLLAFVSLLLSWPSFLIYTVAEVNTTSTMGYDCTTNNDPRATIYFFVYNVIHFLIFIGSTIVLTVLYIIVGKNLRKHRNFRLASLRKTSKCTSVSETSASSRPNNKNEVIVDVISGNHQLTPDEFHPSNSANTANEYDNTYTERKRTVRNSEMIENPNKQYIRLTISSVRYTCITISVTIAFILSFLPYLCISVWRSVHQMYEWNILTESELLAVEIFVRSFLINSAVNPLIYGFFNRAYRTFVIDTLKTCLCCKREDKDDQVNVSSQLSSL